MGQRVTDRVLEEIRSRTDIVELVNSRVALLRAGSSFKACCPFHKEKTPSFHVNPARQSYHCFGCGVHGDAFKFLMVTDGLGFMEAVQRLAERAGVKLDLETDYAAVERERLHAIHAELAAFYRRCLLQTAEAEAARAYLASRKLGDEVAERFGIGYAPRGADVLLRWGAKHGFAAEALVGAGLLAPSNDPGRPDDYYDRFRGRLMFPIADAQGRVVAFSGRILDPKAHPAKYVNSPETPIFVKSRILYALDKARATIVRSPRREALVCEGQIDVIRCHAAGFDTAVASQGTAFTRDHVEILKRYADSVLLVFDGDAAGRKAALRTGGLFLECGVPVRVAALPPGDDPDSLIRDRGPDAFRARLDEAVSLTAFQVRVLREEERDPEAVDAVSRVSRAVVESLAPCPNAVLRSHLAQEAAALLHLPPAAVEEELDACRRRLAARPPPRAEPGVRSAEGGHATPDTRHPTPDPGPRPPALSAAEHDLCELLIHHGDDDAVAELIELYLPPEKLAHAEARAVHAQWQADRKGHVRPGGAAHDLQGVETAAGDRGVRRLISRGHSRVESAREATPRDAVAEVLGALWAGWLKAERAALMSRTELEAERRRLEIVVRLKALRQPKDQTRCLDPQEKQLWQEKLFQALAVEMSRLRGAEAAAESDKPDRSGKSDLSDSAAPAAAPTPAPKAEAEDWLAEGPP